MGVQRTSSSFFTPIPTFYGTCPRDIETTAVRTNIYMEQHLDDASTFFLASVFLSDRSSPGVFALLSGLSCLLRPHDPCFFFPPIDIVVPWAQLFVDPSSAPDPHGFGQDGKSQRSSPSETAIHLTARRQPPLQLVPRISRGGRSDAASPTIRC